MSVFTTTLESGYVLTAPYNVDFGEIIIIGLLLIILAMAALGFLIDLRNA